MHIHIIDRFADLSAVRENWDAVYEADPEARFFLSWQWLYDWLQVHRTAWLVLAAQHEENDREYVAFLTLRIGAEFAKSCGFFNVLLFGGTGFSDYAGILVRPEHAAEALPAFAEYLKRELNWARFTMHNLTMSDERRQLFVGAFDPVRFAHHPLEQKNPGETTDHAICLSIDLPPSWEDYLQSLSANNRQKIRRLLRKVDAAETYRITLSDGDDCDRNLETLLGFWRAKWAPSKGEKNADELAALNQAVLERCACAGTLLLPVFWHRDRPVAALAILIDWCKRSLLFFIAGRDEAYREMPAGYLLHAYSIRYAIAQGFTTYDFLKGDDPYKFLFAPQRRQRQHGVVVATRTGRNLGGRLDPRGLSAALEVILEMQDRGETAEAAFGYGEILETDPDHALALYRLGRLVAESGDHDAARELFSRSVALDPNGDNAWSSLAYSLHACGAEDAARDACHRALALTPEHEEAALLLHQLTYPPQPAFGSAIATARLQPVVDADWQPAAAPAIAQAGAPEREPAVPGIHDQIEEYLHSYISRHG
ncbi:MAG TPA: GNAT family N-acetyltransferase [Stellaceae bacterium]|nr:GNAT family N-acetyltransferase [Stellaceae bacterium]